MAAPRFASHFHIDESGNPHLTANTLRAGHRIFVLTAIATPASATVSLCHGVDQVVKQHFPGLDPNDVEIKSTRLRNRQPPFDCMTDGELRAFTDDLYAVLLDNRRAIRLFAFVMDKQAHVDQYVYPHDPYEEGYKMLLERFVYFLGWQPQADSGHVFLDSRQKVGRHAHDRRLRQFDTALRKVGTGNLNAQQLAKIRAPQFLDSEQSRMIQLVDLCAYNTYRVWAYDEPNYPYFERILPLFDRGPYKRLSGCGIKLFPKTFEKRGRGYIDGR